MKFSIEEINATKASAQPRLEITIRPDFGDIDGIGSKHELVQVTAMSEFSSGSHAGLTVPQMHFPRANGDRATRIEQITGYIELTHHGLERIEGMRDAYGRDLNLELDFSILAIRDGDFVFGGGKDSDIIKDRDWEAVLDDLGYHDRRVVEFAVPETKIGNLLENAHGQLAIAEEHHDAHRYDDALGAVKKALLKMKHIEGDEDFIQSLDKEKRKRLLESIDEFESSITRIKNIADLGDHPAEQITNMEIPPLRRDSELAIDVSKSYLRYFGRVLEED